MDSVGVEPVCPQDLVHEGQNIEILKQSGHNVSAINVNLKGEDLFRAGSFTNPDASIRKKSIDYMKKATAASAQTPHRLSP